MTSVWPKLVAEEITDVLGVKDQTKEELVNDIGLNGLEAELLIAAISPKAKAGAVVCAYKGQHGNCGNAPQGGRLHCPRHLCRTCDNGKPSGKKDKCANCDVAGNDTYVFIEPPLPLPVPAAASGGAATAPNPFGAAPATAPATAKARGGGGGKGGGGGGGGSKKAPPAALAQQDDDDGGDNPFGGQVQKQAENPFNYASVSPGEGGGSVGGGAPIPASPKSPPIQYAKLDLAAKPAAAAAAAPPVEDDDALYGTATTFSGAGKGFRRAGSVIHAEDTTLYAQIDPEATVAQADDLYAEGAIDTNDNGMYAQVDIETPEQLAEGDDAVYGTATSFARGAGKGMTRTGSMIHTEDPNLYATVAPDDDDDAAPESAAASADDFYSEGAVNMNDDGNYANLDVLENDDGDEFE